jgi:TetR/AcrR family transcriptional regulator, lmrAB and yxaGH operons repressor
MMKSAHENGPTMDTKERFLQTSRQLFQQQGYHGTGLNQILALSQAPKGSFYHHFPQGKAQLAAESIELAGAELEEMIKACMLRAASPEEAVTAFVRKIAKWFKNSGYSAGCPITSVLLDTVPEDALTSKACREVFSRWLSLWQSYFEKNGLTASDAEYLATSLVIGLEGAWILSRGMQSLKAFDYVARILGDQLKTLSR